MRVKAHIHHEAGAYDDDGVAIGGCLCDLCACNVATRPRSVIDVELLAKGG